VQAKRNAVPVERSIPGNLVDHRSVIAAGPAPRSRRRTRA
jgi:hypothetical protein